MKLFLDDERVCPTGWFHARTAQEAIDWLFHNWSEVDEISLDHDLGPSYNGNGYDVIRWIEDQVTEGLFVDIPEIHFHTANPVGRDNMQRCLNKIKDILVVI